MTPAAPDLVPELTDDAVRRLPKSQRAAWIVHYKLGPERAQAWERQRLNGKHSSGMKGLGPNSVLVHVESNGRQAAANSVLPHAPVPSTGKAAEILGRRYHLSSALIEKAARLHRTHPESFTQLLAGTAGMTRLLQNTAAPTRAQRSAPQKTRSDRETWAQHFLEEL